MAQRKQLCCWWRRRKGGPQIGHGGEYCCIEFDDVWGQRRLKPHGNSRKSEHREYLHVVCLYKRWNARIRGVHVFHTGRWRGQQPKMWSLPSNWSRFVLLWSLFWYCNDQHSNYFNANDDWIERGGMIILLLVGEEEIWWRWAYILYFFSLSTCFSSFFRLWEVFVGVCVHNLIDAVSMGKWANCYREYGCCCIIIHLFWYCSNIILSRWILCCLLSQFVLIFFTLHHQITA